MSAAAMETSAQKYRAWFILTIAFFLAQLAMLFAFSSRQPDLSPQPSVFGASIRIVTEQVTPEQLSREFLADDPTLFASANVHGFSGAAWLKAPEKEYEKVDFAERAEPYWLTLNSNRLGDGINRFLRTNNISTTPAFKNPGPRIQFASLPNNSEGKTGSTLRIEGELADREVLNFPMLQSWAHTNLLSNTVAQISINRDGLVLSTRLMERSGSSAADMTALNTARILRFSYDPKTEIAWGKLIFDWHTLGGTNSEQKVSIP